MHNHGRFHSVEFQSLRNQGFIRTRSGGSYDPRHLVSIPSKSGFHSNWYIIPTSAERASQSLRNQGFIRTRAGVSASLGRRSQSLRNQGFIRTEYGVRSGIANRSQSLRNQGFIRTRVWKEQYNEEEVSIPSKSGFHSNYEFISLPQPVGSQSLRNQGFIRTAPTVNGFSLLSSRGSVPILSVLS